MAVTGTIFPKQYANVIIRHKQKKRNCPMKHLLEINKKTEDRSTFVISNIVSIVSSPSNKTDQYEVNAIQDYFNVAGQVHIVNKKQILQKVDIWSLKSESQQWNGLSNHALLEQKRLATHWDRK